MKKIVIVTSNSLRHKAFRVYLSNCKGIKVLQTISEKKNNVKDKLKKSLNNNLQDHLKNRDQVEEDFFGLYLKTTKDNSKNLYKNYNYSSSKVFLENIKRLKPNLIVVYGSSLIKGEILNLYKNRILNVHLGLSPYYKGSATNYFTLVNKKPEYLGATFMFLDKTIDGGKIIHQIRPKINPKDNAHQIGTRLILEMFELYKKIILNFDKIKIKKIKSKIKSKFYKKADFTLSSLKKHDLNFKKSMIKNYLNKKKKEIRKLL